MHLKIRVYSMPSGILILIPWHNCAGTFHLLHMLIDDYISHCLETLLEDEAQRAHFTNINLPTPGKMQCKYYCYVIITVHTLAFMLALVHLYMYVCVGMHIPIHTSNNG